MFVRLTDTVSVAGQIAPADLASAPGFTTVVNNRPDGEEAGQPSGAAMQAAAVSAVLAYFAIPIDHGGFTVEQVDAMAAVLNGASGPVLAWCRSGTRSANLWALAEARRGGDPDAIVAAAAGGRYDVSALLPTLRRLSAR